MLYTTNGTLIDKSVSSNGSAQFHVKGIGMYLVKWANNIVKVIVPNE